MNSTAALSISIKVLKSGKTDSGEDGCSDYFAQVAATDIATGETLKFICRNVLDVGYVVNPDYKITAESDSAGGLATKKNGRYFWQDYKSGQGWENVREMTGFESRTYQYLNAHSPIYDGLNMQLTTKRPPERIYHHGGPLVTRLA